MKDPEVRKVLIKVFVLAVALALALAAMALFVSRIPRP